MSHEPHPWAEMDTADVLALLTRELYSPVSALASGLERLFEEPLEPAERDEIHAQLRDALDQLSRLVVLLKRYG